MKLRRQHDKSALMLMVNTVLFGAGAGLVVLSWIKAIQVPGRESAEILNSILHLQEPLLLITVALLLGGVFHSFTILYPVLLQNWAERQKALEDVDDFRDQAYRDPLTGLRNRRYFDPMLNAYFDEFQRMNLQCGLLVLDIDHFKSINDTHGHAAGDEVLKSLAKRLSGMVRENDVVARIGGEEFAILLAHMSKKPLEELSERVRREVAEMEVEFEGTILRPTISIGAILSSDFITAEQMLPTADAYLYKAKALGRNRVVTKTVMEETEAEARSHGSGGIPRTPPASSRLAAPIKA